MPPADRIREQNEQDPGRVSTREIMINLICCMSHCRNKPTVLSLVAVKHLVEGTVTVSERQTDVTVTVRLSHGSAVMLCQISYTGWCGEK